MKNERNLPLPPGPRYRPTTAPKLDAQLDACVRRGGGLSSGQLGAGNCDALLVQTNRQPKVQTKRQPRVQTKRQQAAAVRG